MIQRMPRAERGYSDYGWLKTYQSFSFGNYYAPENKGYSVLRVLNEDRVSGGAGFSLHEHHDAEILTYVLKGALRHEDTLGHQALLEAGMVQRISAGAGIKHSEVNPSTTEEGHFLQIWILPDEAGVAPSYDQRAFPREGRVGVPTLVASPEGPLTIRQDCRVYLAALEEGQDASMAIAPERRVYVHVVEGVATVNGLTVVMGDGLKVDGEPELRLRGDTDCELLLFEMP